MQVVVALLFGSGLCALVYQVAWLRELRLVFGASTAASSAAIAIFIAGLGAGAWVLGKRAEKSARPLALYSTLEAIVAITAALSPVALWAVRKIYLAIGGSTALGTAGGSIVRLLLAALVLGPPTFVMGGTLPAAARAIESEADEDRRRVAWLYGANTIGAVVGALATTFLLIEVLGARLTVLCAALVNLLIAVIARAVARSLPDATSRGVGAEDAPRADVRLVLAAAALVGFVFFLLEVVWYRLLGPILGGSVFTFGLILAIALAGIGIGSAWWAASSRARAPTAIDLAWTCCLQGFFVALAWALGDRVALLAASLGTLSSFSFVTTLLSWSVVASIVVLPASIVAGAQFPLLIALLGRGREGVGRDVGRAYAFNTAGATLGALAGGFGLLPAIGATGAYRACAATLVLLGIVVIVQARTWRKAIAPACIAGIALILLRATGPTAAWRHTPIAAGRADIARLGGPNAVIDAIRERRRRVYWEAEGIESSVAMDLGSSISFYVNGKSDGSARADAATQVMGGLVGAALHPSPKRALVIGLGTGSTAGWLAKVPGIDHVDAIELEPAILHVARACAAVNGDVMHDPKVTVKIGDAREALLTSRETWDIVFSEPSNPYRAGIASLFTRELYRGALARLSEEGVFLQWIQAYDIDAQTIRTVIATMASELGAVEIWQLRSNDLLLVGSRKPIVHDLARIRARLDAWPFKHAMGFTWGTTGIEGFYGHFVANDALARKILALEGEALNTDDHTLVEYGFARSLGRAGTFDLAELRALARSRGEDKPQVSGPIDWDRALDAHAIAIAREGESVTPEPHLSAQAMIRAHALALWVRGDLSAAAATWRKQPLEPSMPLELLAIGEARAETGDESATEIADRLRSFQSIEADLILARLRLRQGHFADAASLLEKALVAHRDDPWPNELVIQRALELARTIVERHPASAEKMWAALDRPFAAYDVEELRRIVRTKLVVLPPLRTRCVEAFSSFEPHTPWNGPFLTLRRDCYAAKGDPRAPLAQTELIEFSKAEPTPIGSGLGPK